MLPLLCSLAFTQSSIEFEIPVRYMRASRLAEMLRGSKQYPAYLPPSAQVVSDDDKSTVKVKGNADEVLDARRFAKLIDVPHPTIRLQMHVDSPADRFNYDVSAGLQSGQLWHMNESATGLDLGVTPRLNADGTCTLLCAIEHETGKVTTVFRMKPGQPQTVVLGKKLNAAVYVVEGSKKVSYSGSPLPTIRFSFDVEKPH